MPRWGAKTSCPLPSVTSGDAARNEVNRRKRLICSGWYGATVEDPAGGPFVTIRLGGIRRLAAIRR
jgi:hypothetical protein